jgi:hypothetical protein
LRRITVNVKPRLPVQDNAPLFTDNASLSEANVLHGITVRRKNKAAGEKPTVKRQLLDANAIIRGKKNGKFTAGNVKPHLAGGKHKAIDETFSLIPKYRIIS